MSFFWEKKKSLVILIVLIFLQIVLISLQVPQGKEASFFEKTIFSIFSPLQHGMVSGFHKIGDLWEEYFYLKNTKSQNEELKEEIFLLRQENVLIKNALRKLKTEKEIQETLRTIRENIVHVRVIGMDLGNYHKSVTINKGSLDEIRKDMVVLDKYGHLVGRVFSPVSLKEARVQLVTDNDSGISVYTQDKEGWGILVGDAKGQCNLNFILTTDENLHAGDQIVTTGFDGIFPPGLEVGEIVSIEKTTDLFKSIKVRPYFKFRDLDNLAVIKFDPREIY